MKQQLLLKNGNYIKLPRGFYRNSFLCSKMAYSGGTKICSRNFQRDFRILCFELEIELKSFDGVYLERERERDKKWQCELTEIYLPKSGHSPRTISSFPQSVAQTDFKGRGQVGGQVQTVKATCFNCQLHEMLSRGVKQWSEFFARYPAGTHCSDTGRLTKIHCTEKSSRP